MPETVDEAGLITVFQLMLLRWSVTPFYCHRSYPTLCSLPGSMELSEASGKADIKPRI